MSETGAQEKKKKYYVNSFLYFFLFLHLWFQIRPLETKEQFNVWMVGVSVMNNLPIINT